MKTEGGRVQDFERFLEDELTGHLGRLSGPSPLPAQAAFRRGGGVTSIAASATAAISSRAAMALAAAALIVGDGSVAAAAATGSPNPSVWGRTVSTAAQTCRADLSSGSHGIGPCVSAIAQSHRQSQPSTGTMPAVRPTPLPTAVGTAPAVTAPAATPPSRGRRTTLPTPAMNAPDQARRPAGAPAGRPSPAPEHNR